MNDTVNSHAQQTVDACKKLVDEQLSRASSVAAEIGKLETKGLEQARTLVDDYVALAQGSLALMGQIAATEQALEAWKSLAGQQSSRAGALAAEVARAQGKGIEQARTLVGEMGTLSKESLAWACTLSAEWRKLGLEVARKSATWPTPGL
jgi:hypothetical protein